MQKKAITILIVAAFAGFGLSGCARFSNIKLGNEQLAMMIKNYYKKKNEVKKPLLFKISSYQYKGNFAVAKVVKHPSLRPEVAPAMASIEGATSGLPILTVREEKVPLWKILENLGSKTGYIFNAKGINLGKTKTINKKDINLAILMATMFPYYQTSIDVAKKEVDIDKS